MNLHVIHAGNFKLDGGAMFGVVPKVMWNKLNPADENNMCTWALRCLLIEDGKRLILIDTGAGDKQDAKFKGHFYLSGEKLLENALKAKGFSPDDITDVFLTHLHFDHCGGAVTRRSDGQLVPTFKNAVYWSNTAHWDWALKPNAREKASFLQENIKPIQESGQLQFISAETPFPHASLQVEFLDGHTEKQMIPIIPYKNHHLVFAADLFPSIHHVRMPYVMSYDLRPLLTLQEKEKILKKAVQNDWLLFFEHDHANECASVTQTEAGIVVEKSYLLSEI
ncbi:MAG: MBL fold metallo-hydrolase [Cytophagales bacterium]|nr:MAG: MBL fold metallo-hydrolase [Cytophagales bacterium]TAF61312.1 MAG: MBL fold metallo-hydrolase [Cytophagales bacterium]